MLTTLTAKQRNLMTLHFIFFKQYLTEHINIISSQFPVQQIHSLVWKRVFCHYSEKNLSSWVAETNAAELSTCHLQHSGENTPTSFYDKVEKCPTLTQSILI